MNRSYDVYKKGDEEYLIATCDCCGRREKTMCRVVRLTGEQMKSWFAIERREILISCIPLATSFLILAIASLAYQIIPEDRGVLGTISYLILPLALAFVAIFVTFVLVSERFDFVRRRRESEEQQRKHVLAELGMESVEFKGIRFHGTPRINEAAEESYIFVEQDVVLKYHD